MGLAPTGKRRLFTAHAGSGRSPVIRSDGLRRCGTDGLQTLRWRETDSNRRSLSCTHRPLVAEGNAVAIERGGLVIVVFLMRARGIPLPPPVCPSAYEISARSPRVTGARDGVAAAPGLSCQRASGQCDVGTVRPPDGPPLSPACGKQNSDTCFDQSEVFSPVALTKIEV